jgi:hypothetical protein
VDQQRLARNQIERIIEEGQSLGFALLEQSFDIFDSGTSLSGFLYPSRLTIDTRQHTIGREKRGQTTSPNSNPAADIERLLHIGEIPSDAHQPEKVVIPPKVSGFAEPVS